MSYKYPDYAALDTELLHLLRNAEKATTIHEQEQTAATAVLASKDEKTVALIAALNDLGDDDLAGQVIQARAKVAAAADRKAELKAKLEAAVADRQDAIDSLLAEGAEKAVVGDVKARVAELMEYKAQVLARLK